jgi:hypothetical protein
MILEEKSRETITQPTRVHKVGRILHLRFWDYFGHSSLYVKCLDEGRLKQMTREILPYQEVFSSIWLLSICISLE